MAVHNNCPKPYLPKYRDHVLKSGLKFEKDRSFKNRLIVKAILLMSILLVAATCGFVAWSKIKGFQQTTAEQSLQVTTITKVLLNYDLDSESMEHLLLPDVRTQFVPPELPVSIPIPSNQETIPEQVPKLKRVLLRRRRNATCHNHDYDDADSVSEEVVWVKVSDKTKRNVKVDSVTIGGATTAQAKVTKNTFWSGDEDAQTIRDYQANKMKDFMDASADPCQDFYQYACGRWMEHNAIPDDRAAFDTFEILRDSLDAVLRDLLEERNNSTPVSNQSAIEKAKILYRSCMDEDTLEKRSNAPLLKFIDLLGGWPVLNPSWNDSNFDWVELAAKLRLYYNDVLLTHWIGQDFMVSSNYIIQFDQTNLGLSTREYFLKDSNKAYKEAYKKFLEEVAILMGAEPGTAVKDAGDIVAFETSLANITLPQDVRRNISEMYEKLTVSDLEVQIPHVAWRRYLTIVLGEPVKSSEPIVLFARKYYMLLGDLLSTTPSRTIANYMMWRFVKHRINNLDSKYQDAKQTFLHALFGREKSPPRWTVCVHHVNGHMGMALGSMFVNRYFDENSKNNTVDMTQSILETFEDMINGITWIDDETRQLAKNKVKAIILRIGYPDFILDHQQLDDLFKKVTVLEDKYFENSLAALKFTAKFESDRLRTVVDKKYWNISPAVVNAYYHRNKNQIMFPAGILQPPFYHRHFPRSLNFGGIGVVIGHEIIHGFDDKGRLYDLEGNLNRWWKPNAIEEFRQRAKCLIDQYNSYLVQEIDMHIDGVNTQGENIADNGGIKQAFRAYEKWVNINGDANENLRGINATNYQLFFINFAQVWCGSMRPEASRNKIQTSAHPPGKIRVIGTLTNSEEFARVFNCPVDSRMNPREKCRVW